MIPYRLKRLWVRCWWPHRRLKRLQRRLVQTQRQLSQLQASLYQYEQACRERELVGARWFTRCVNAEQEVAQLRRRLKEVLEQPL